MHITVGRPSSARTRGPRAFLRSRKNPGGGSPFQCSSRAVEIPPSLRAFLIPRLCEVDLPQAAGQFVSALRAIFRFFLQTGHVLPCLLDRIGRIADRDKRVHQAQHHPRVVRIVGRYTSPPSGRLRKIAYLLGASGEAATSGRSLSRVPSTLKRAP